MKCHVKINAHQRNIIKAGAVHAMASKANNNRNRACDNRRLARRVCHIVAGNSRHSISRERPRYGFMSAAAARTSAKCADINSAALVIKPDRASVLACRFVVFRGALPLCGLAAVAKMARPRLWLLSGQQHHRRGAFSARLQGAIAKYRLPNRPGITLCWKHETKAWWRVGGNNSYSVDNNRRVAARAP